MITVEKGMLTAVNAASVSSLLAQTCQEFGALLARMKGDDWELGDDFDHEELDGMFERMTTGTQIARNFLDQCINEPLRKLRSGAALTEREYYFLRALGLAPDYATLSGFTAEGEYQFYKLLRYDDGECRGVIVTAVCEASLYTPEGPAPMFAMVRPEQVKRHRLTPRQEAFIRANFPQDYPRMQP